MIIPDIIIAVDGYSSTGKSSLAKLLAAEFGYQYLDSGALYRAVTLYAQEHSMIDAESNIDHAALSQALDGGVDIHFVGSDTYIGDRCIEAEVRSLSVANQVSPISAVPYIRNFVDMKLHEWGDGGRVVMDGRDIGTAVFPQAQLKIFVTADPAVRAKRRFDEMVAKGGSPVLEEVVKNLSERDYIDSHRDFHPLRQAEDAYVLDNTNMTLGEEVAWVWGLVRGKFGILE